WASKRAVTSPIPLEAPVMTMCCPPKFMTNPPSRESGNRRCIVSRRGAEVVEGFSLRPLRLCAKLLLGSRLRGNDERRRSRQPQNPRGVVLQDQRHDLFPEAHVLRRLDPLVGVDQ